jgi:hypothetical protein
VRGRGLDRSENIADSKVVVIECGEGGSTRMRGTGTDVYLHDFMHTEAHVSTIASRFDFQACKSGQRNQSFDVLSQVLAYMWCEDTCVVAGA